MSLELETVSCYQRHVIVEQVKYMNFIAETRNGEDRYKRKYCVEASPLGLGLGLKCRELVVLLYYVIWPPSNPAQ